MTESIHSPIHATGVAIAIPSSVTFNTCLDLESSKMGGAHVGSRAKQDLTKLADIFKHRHHLSLIPFISRLLGSPPILQWQLDSILSRLLLVGMVCCRWGCSKEDVSLWSQCHVLEEQEGQQFRNTVQIQP